MIRRRAGLAALAALPLGVLAIFFVLPLGGMLGRGLRPDGRLDLGGAWDVLTRPRIAKVLWFTLWSSTVATLITVLLGVPLAYTLYRLRFPGRTVLRALVIVPFVLPTVVVGIAFRTLLSASGPLGFLGLDGTRTAIVAVLVFFNIAVVVRTVGTAWDGLDRRPAEAAATLGAGPAQVFRTVTLPALRPAIASGAAVVFLFCATAFGSVLMLGGQRFATVETEIYLQTTQFLDLRAASVLSVLQVLVVVVLLFGTTRVGGGTVGRSPAAPRRPVRGDVPWLVLTGVVVAALVTPMVTLVVRSLQLRGSWSTAGYRRLGGVAGAALGNSLLTALAATAVSLVLALLIAVVITRPARTRGERRLFRLLDGLFTLPLGVSAVTIGFGFLITLDRPPLDLRSSALLVVIAQALVALPLVLRVIVPALRAIDDRRRQAAATLGAGPLRVFATVDLPIVGRPVLAATGFAFAVGLGEFGATSFLALPDRQTLPVLIYDTIGRPGAENFQLALAASVLLSAVTVAIMVAVEQLRVGSVGAF